MANTYHEALQGASPQLLKCRTGKAAFTFTTLDDDLAGDLEDLIGRLFERYQASHLQP